MVLSSLIPLDFGLVLLVAFLLALVASKTGQPTIMAYIVTGLVLGPVGLGLVGESEFIDVVSELALPMLLFLVGLEMKFDAFRSILSEVGMISIVQIITQQFFAFLVAYAFGFGLLEAFILSMCTIFGATPIVVKMLTDKNEASTTAGRIDIGTLILQDIFLVVVLAFLAAGSISGPGDVVSTLGRILVLSLLIGVLSFLGVKLIEKEVLGDLAGNKHAFFIQAVAWLFFFVLLSNYLGLSMEIGGFLAGLSLGQLPYSIELTEKVRPLTNFFIVVFFAGIGLTLDAGELFVYWKEALIAIVLLSTSAFIVMYILIKWQGFSQETSFKGAINLTMVSEFSLVAGALALQSGLITAGMLGYLTIMKLVTNGYATYLIQYNDKLYSWFEKITGSKDENDTSDREIYDAVILGNSRLDETIRPIIDDMYSNVIFVESDPHEMRKLESEGENFIFGNPRHPEIREDVNMDEAGVVISLEDDFDLNRFLVKELETKFVPLVKDRAEAEKLEEEGAHHVIIEDYAKEKILKKRLKEVLEK